MTGMSGIRSAFAAALGVSDDAAQPDDAPGSVVAGAAQGSADASLLALVDRLTDLLVRSDLAELEVRSGGTSLVLRKAGVPRPADPATMPPAGAGPDATAAARAGPDAMAAAVFSVLEKQLK